MTATVNVFTRHADGYRGKRVVIVGVGNTACDAAVDLSSVCSQVMLRCYLLVIDCMRHTCSVADNTVSRTASETDANQLGIATANLR